MSQKPRLNAAFPIVNADGTMTDAFRKYMLDIGYSLHIVGTGTPEGNVEARQFSTYIDDAGASGSLLYVKKLASITNDTSKGWVAV